MRGFQISGTTVCNGIGAGHGAEIIVGNIAFSGLEIGLFSDSGAKIVTRGGISISNSPVGVFVGAGAFLFMDSGFWGSNAISNCPTGFSVIGTLYLGYTITVTTATTAVHCYGNLYSPMVWG